MVTNLPAEAKAKFAKYMDAKTPEEKLKALEEFLSTVPKHKGTENLVRWARRRMSELREEIDEKRKKKTGGGGPSFFVEKEGAAQVVIIGTTKVGKSTFLKTLTNANVQISDVPYTTRFPAVGMLQYEDIQFQLVESPAIIPEGGGWNTKVVGLAKNSDGVILMLDASRNAVEDFLFVRNFLEEHGLHITKPKGYAHIERRYGGGIRIVNYGKLLCTEEDVTKLLNSYRVYHALVKIYGEVGLEDIEKSIYETTVYKPTIVVVNKIDVNKTLRSVEALRAVVPNDVPIIGASALYRIGLKDVGSTIFKVLDLVRIYTKPPLGKPSDKPLVVKKGTSVLDVAKIIHRELYEKFAYARIWGSSVRYPGQRVGADHILEDRDIVEINIKR